MGKSIFFIDQIIIVFDRERSTFFEYQREKYVSSIYFSIYLYTLLIFILIYIIYLFYLYINYNKRSSGMKLEVLAPKFYLFKLLSFYKWFCNKLVLLINMQFLERHVELHLHNFSWKASQYIINIKHLSSSCRI